MSQTQIGADRETMAHQFTIKPWSIFAQMNMRNANVSVVSCSNMPTSMIIIR